MSNPIEIERGQQDSIPVTFRKKAERKALLLQFKWRNLRGRRAVWKKQPFSSSVNKGQNFGWIVTILGGQNGRAQVLSLVTLQRRRTSPSVSCFPRHASSSDTGWCGQFPGSAPLAAGCPCKYPAPAECASCAFPPAKGISHHLLRLGPSSAAADAPADPQDR